MSNGVNCRPFTKIPAYTSNHSHTSSQKQKKWYQGTSKRKDLLKSRHRLLYFAYTSYSKVKTEWFGTVVVVRPIQSKELLSNS